MITIFMFLLSIKEENNHGYYQMRSNVLSYAAQRDWDLINMDLIMKCEDYGMLWNENKICDKVSIIERLGV